MKSKLRRWVNKRTGEKGAMVWIWCPGCKEAHALEVENKTKACWDWNGSEERPTFSPSLLAAIRGPRGHCHSFIKEGKIQFLGDCTHELRSQTVDLPELPDWLAEE